MNRQQMVDVAIGVIDGYIGQFDGNETNMAEDVIDAIIAAMGDERARFRVRKDAPETSKAIVDKIRTGTLQQVMLDAFRNKAYVFGGATDDEMERFLGRSHQSVSATRNTLVRKGYLVDSGHRRPTRSGNQAIVWTWTGKGEPS